MTNTGLSLPAALTEEILGKLTPANQAFNRRFHGEPSTRQPIHTVYGGAHLFKAESCRKLGDLALATVAEHAPDAASFARALGMPTAAKLSERIYERVLRKLKAEPVEDYRIDFEDGYGYRCEEEEDDHARSAALELARGMKERTLPPFIGIRVKAMNEECKHRSARTLDLFVSTLLAASGGILPDNFVVTLPKATIPEQVISLVSLFRQMENSHKLHPGTFKMELMVEQAQIILNGSGQCNLPLMVEAAAGRCIGAHFGTYDYTASLDITSHHQRLDHPACDFAKYMMKIALAGTGIMLSDGATNIMPVGPHKAGKEIKLSDDQKLENREVVHRGWKLSYQHIRHSLAGGFYQGWDLHPAQLPVRYATSYVFFLEDLHGASTRLKAFVEKAARANIVSGIFDDAASGQGLLNYFLRAINCGAIDEDDLKDSGLSIEEIRSRSFQKIMEGRR